MNHTVSQRYVASIRKLKEEGKIRSFRQFAQSVDYLPQSLSEVINGRRDVTIDLLYKTINHYQLNPTYLFEGTGAMFCCEKDNGFRVVTVMVDQHGEENIVHVPVPAQAGYASGMSTQVMQEELPTYSLPDYQYKSGTFRSFDVSGESMEPSLLEGDKVICSFIEPGFWKHSIKDGQVYVVVTTDDVVVKRLYNRIMSHGEVEAHSDNNYFLPYSIPIGEIKEIWHLKTRISKFDHSRTRQSEDREMVAQYKEIIDRQNKLLRVMENSQIRASV